MENGGIIFAISLYYVVHYLSALMYLNLIVDGFTIGKEVEERTFYTIKMREVTDIEPYSLGILKFLLVFTVALGVLEIILRICYGPMARKGWFVFKDVTWYGGLVHMIKNDGVGNERGVRLGIVRDGDGANHLKTVSKIDKLSPLVELEYETSAPEQLSRTSY